MTMRKTISVLVVGVFLLTGCMPLAATTLNSANNGALQQDTQAAAAARSVDDTNTSARADIAAAMAAEAARRGLTLSTDDLIFASRGDVVAANVPLAGIEQLSEGALAAGADIGMAYLSLPAGSGIAKGFYTIRLTLAPGSSSGTAQLIDGAGKVAASVAVQNNVNEAPLIRLVFTLVIGPNFVCFDFHFRVGRFWIAGILCIFWAAAAPAPPVGTPVSTK